jgi:hypothetical protein
VGSAVIKAPMKSIAALGRLRISLKRVANVTGKSLRMSVCHFLKIKTLA